MVLKAVRTRPGHSLINVRVLILIYFLLCVLTIFFSRSFFIDTLRDGKAPDLLNLIVFFTIPVVLLIFLGISVFSLFTDIVARRPGSKFKARLLAYFFTIVVFAATPATVMTGVALTEIVRFWNNINTPAAVAAANNYAVESYRLHLIQMENIIKQTDFTRRTLSLPRDIAAVQIFENTGRGWTETSFTGEEHLRLPYPPVSENGPVTRDKRRDPNVIRYVKALPQKRIALISYNLGDDFDSSMAALENQAARFETIGLIKENLKPLLIFYYGVFFFPTLLITVIIAISFTRRVTHPIVELTEATRRVAEGDLSIQILARRSDELGLLIRSFNAMVQDLDKSRTALVKAEKISIWQNMAQQLAHEIKNPLTPIKLSAERVLRRWQNDPQNIGEILENSMMGIIQETEGLTTLLDKFRTLSKPMETSQSWTKLRETVEETAALYSNSYSGIKFDIDHVDTLISVKIEKHRLSQILTNLVINAIDAMNGNGSIEIRTDLVKKREISYCRLSVKDSGKGISGKNIQMVFTPYYTTKESGTGLGLPIVERIVNDHGGAIWFNSAENMGTTFFIDLPAELPPDSESPAGKTKTAGQSSSAEGV